jgi:hypothetical protein
MLSSTRASRRALSPNPRLQRTLLRHLFAEALAKVEGCGGQARFLELSRSSLSHDPLGGLL